MRRPVDRPRTRTGPWLAPLIAFLRLRKKVAKAGSSVEGGSSTALVQLLAGLGEELAETRW